MRKNGTPLRISFADFENGFDQEDNWLARLLMKRYDLCLSDDPEYLFFSNYGHAYLDYSCPRIFVSCENTRVFRYKADFIFESDFHHCRYRFRLPYYRMRYTEDELKTPRDWETVLYEKRGFACQVVSNPMGRERNEFWDCLARIGPVASGGHFRNNIGGPVESKLNFCRGYKFCIAFENSARTGYLTEKLIDAWMAGCIPIYWGDDNVETEINPGCFIHARDFNTWEDLAEYVQLVGQNDDLYRGYLQEPLLLHGVIQENLSDASILNAFDLAMRSGHRISPTFKKMQRALRRPLTVRNRIRGLLRKNWYSQE